jgi:hypothetical protein
MYITKEKKYNEINIYITKRKKYNEINKYIYNQQNIIRLIYLYIYLTTKNVIKLYNYNELFIIKARLLIINVSYELNLHEINTNLALLIHHQFNR